MLVFHGMASPVSTTECDVQESTDLYVCIATTHSHNLCIRVPFGQHRPEGSAHSCDCFSSCTNMRYMPLSDHAWVAASENSHWRFLFFDCSKRRKKYNEQTHRNILMTRTDEAGYGNRRRPDNCGVGWHLFFLDTTPDNGQLPAIALS